MGGTQNNDFVRAAAALGPEIRASADDTERGRDVTSALLDKLIDARLFDLVLPRSIGGVEADIETMVRVIEAISNHDGATGWAVGIGLGTSVVSAFVDDSTAREIFTPRAIIGGPMAPNGRAVPVDGGYRVTGRWPFASGSPHCAWLIGGSIVFEGDTPRMMAGGMPDWRITVFPRADVEIVDTWSVMGLRGTGSHDIVVTDAFVPERRAISFVGTQPKQPGPLYAFATLGFLALTVAPVATGVARRAIDEFVTLAHAKTSTGQSVPLKDRGAVQQRLGQAEAELRAGRALMYETTAEMWDSVVAGNAPTTAQRAMLRMACAHACTASVRAVDTVYELAGTTSIFDSHILQRCFRDVHTATQHLMLNTANYDTAGQMLLGIQPSLIAL